MAVRTNQEYYQQLTIRNAKKQVGGCPFDGEQTGSTKPPPPTESPMPDAPSKKIAPKKDTPSQVAEFEWPASEEMGKMRGYEWGYG